MALPIPTRPCPYCTSASFARLNDASVDLAPSGAYSSSNCPRFTLLMCLGCGWIASFVTDPRQAVEYFKGHAERVDIPGQPPYR